MCRVTRKFRPWDGKEWIAVHHNTGGETRKCVRLAVKVSVEGGASIITDLGKVFSSFLE